MVEFIGTIPLNGQSIAELQDPFQHLKGQTAVSPRFEHLRTDGSHFQFMSQNGKPDVFSDEDHFLLLHGDCYTKINESSLKKKRKLNAVDLNGLYLEYGKEFVDKIKGSFAIVLIDRKKNIVKAFNDPLNLRTVYFTTTNKELVISSTLSAVVNHLSQMGIPLKVDQYALADRLLFDFVLDNRTYIEDVREMPAGSMLELSAQNLAVTPYFDSFSYFDLSGPKLSHKKGAKKLQGILKANIDLYTQGADHTAVALTGGFDSRSIAALLGEDLNDYQLYSYGKEGSWDLKIPQLIADRLKLKYEPIFLDENYEANFPEYANLAVLLGDGITEFSQANISYVCGRYFNDKRSLLTGLFGSEMIKTPSSRGLYIDHNMIELLNAEKVEPVIRKLIGQLNEKQLGLDIDEEKMVDRILSHPYINNDLPVNEKYFHYLLMVGTRRYFSKEIKIQKVLKNNLHPFFDLEFINVLLETPYPWVYNFTKEKSLWKNLSIHKLYGLFIHANPSLSNIISTHGFRPRYLLSKLNLPLLAIEYLTYKKKISKSSTLNFQRELSIKHIQKNEKAIFDGLHLNSEKVFALKQSDRKNFIKFSSLQFWLKSLGMSL